MGIEQLIQDLKAQNLTDEQILQALEQMLQEQKITEEDLLKAKQLLGGNHVQEVDDEAEEQKKAEQLFGMKFI